MRNLLFLIVLLALSCKPTSTKVTSETIPADPSFGKYVLEYTKQRISVKNDLVFRLSGAVITHDKVGELVDKDLFAISPKVDGKAYWKDMSTIIFTPSEQMEYNTNYN